MGLDSKTRRQVLRNVAATGVGLTAISGVGVTSADGCELTCEDGIYVKYELVEHEDGTCTFEEETDTGIYSDLTITDTKDGDSCEPLEVEWDDSEYETITLVAKGSNDCDTESNPNGTYRSNLENKGGKTAAISNLQFCVHPVDGLECPDGTSPVARYDVDGDTITFTGGEDVVTFSNTTTDSNGNLTGFDFASTDGSDDNSEPETLTTVTVEYDSTVETFEVDPDFDADKQSGSVSVSGDIDRILFCQAVYAQADFVTGGVIQDLCTDGYSGNKISSITWSSYNRQLDGTQGQFDGSWDIGTDAVTVNYDPADYDQKVSLAVYEVDDPVFQENNNISFSDTKCRQTLVDSDTDEVGDQDGVLTADLPML